MTDLKLLDGKAADIMKAAAALSAEDRAALLTAEQGGKNRSTVIAALQPISEEEGQADEAAAALSSATVISADAQEGFEASGAPQVELEGVNLDHPAVDANPRANTTETQNRIDFNDPSKSGVDVVSEQLGMAKPDDAAAE